MILKFRGQAVIMGCEEADASDMRSNVMEHRLGDGKAVVRRSSAPELVQDDERTGVASDRIFLVSDSSTKKVLWAAKMLSLAPRRDMIRSTGVRRAEAAGT